LVLEPRAREADADMILAHPARSSNVQLKCLRFRRCFLYSVLPSPTTCQDYSTGGKKFAHHDVLSVELLKLVKC
jgi:hypothetical protein